jgi:hypothetical protein
MRALRALVLGAIVALAIAGVVPAKSGVVARLENPVALGGVRSIVIALPGWATDVNGTRRADWRLPIVNDPTR